MARMKKDIETRKDIESLVNHFYDKVKDDAVIGFIFNDIVQVDWKHHLPIMYDFWENIIFNTGGYTGNPMKIHQQLNQVVPLSTEHFREWLHLFIATVNELFEGGKAELAKQRATSISTMMQLKFTHKTF